MTSIPLSEQGGRVVLALPADLDLASARPLAESLVKAMASGKPVEVAAAAVERAGTAAIQALVSATRSASPDGLRVSEPSPAFVEICRALGLEGWLAGWSGT